LKKTMGRLAGAVLAGALITLAVSPAALAQETDPTSVVVAPPENTTTTEPSTPTSETTTQPEVPTSTPGTTDTATPPNTTTKPGEPTKTSEPGTPTSTPTETTPEEPPYQDDTAVGFDLPDNEGLLLISCAAGEPTEVYSPDFDLVEGPVQSEADGRVWGWLVKRHEGVSFDAGNVTAHWKCGGAPTETPVKPGGGAGSGSETTKGKDSQVKYAPKGGVETGFGGTAQA
jgi:hypothetical protein